MFSGKNFFDFFSPKDTRKPSEEKEKRKRSDSRYDSRKSSRRSNKASARSGSNKEQKATTAKVEVRAFKSGKTLLNDLQSEVKKMRTENRRLSERIQKLKSPSASSQAATQSIKEKVVPKIAIETGLLPSAPSSHSDSQRAGRRKSGA